MSKEKFTPGPWVARVEYKKSRLSNQTYMLCSVHADDKCITDSVYVIHDNMDEAAANTRLIAAAPEMYEALKKLKECIEDYFGKNEREFLKCGDKDVDGFFAQQYIAACNALKKARGEE